MKILVTSKYNHPKYLSILDALKKKKAEIRLAFVLSEELIKETNPDLIISDSSNKIKGIKHLLLYTNDSQELASDMGYNLDDLEPYVNPILFENPKETDFYKSDLTYINSGELPKEIIKFLTMDRKVKIFGNPQQVWCYCGILRDDVVQNVYASTQCALATPLDLKTQYEIILSGKKPCLTDSEESIEKGLNGEFPRHIKKEDILKNHTNWNRLNWLNNKFKLGIK